MTKQDNLFQLYDLLTANGSKGDAITFIANLCKIKRVSVKGNWFSNREFPNRVTENQLDEIISYLQKAIMQQNITKK